MTKEITLTKADFAQKLRTTLGAKYRDTDSSFLMFVSGIIHWLTEKASEPNASVMISGFGKFKNSYKRERIGRDPLTGEKMMISARNVVTFNSGPSLYKKIRNKKPKKISSKSQQKTQSVD